MKMYCQVLCRIPTIALSMMLIFCFGAQAGEELTEAMARAALRRAVVFFRTQVSASGSYLWRYSSDLSKREGEIRASDSTGWVQPPGTPSVGEAYLRAYECTAEPYLLEAAQETGRALVMGQLRSGGWDYRIEFDPEARRKYAYRLEPSSTDGTNVTTLDDNTTQAAVSFLMRLDKAKEFKEMEIHECVMYALDALVQAQYPNGAWPQRFTTPPNPSEFPVKPGGYPTTWSRQYPGQDYRSYYTLNDNVMGDMIELMLDAWNCYGEERYREAAIRGGDFLILAQMPEPQPGWAQQYDTGMHPAWARKFEPPSITGSESQSAIQTLILLAMRTKQQRFLEPVPKAIAYFRKSLLPDGRLARFYELHTNRPLFFTKDYTLTYDGGDVPTHYNFFSASKLDNLEAMYAEAMEGKSVQPTSNQGVSPAVDLEREARLAVKMLDERGAWLLDKPLRTFSEENPQGMTIDSAVFAQRVDALSSFIALKKNRK